MFNRVLTFKGATDIDGGVTYLRDRRFRCSRHNTDTEASPPAAIGPAASSGSCQSGTLHRTGRQATARWERPRGALKIVGGDLTIENFEEVVLEMVRPPSPGCGLFVTRVHMDPSVIEENLEFFKSDVLPQIKSQPGFCGLRNMMDSATGRAIVGSVWDTHAQAETMQATAPERRARAEERGVSFDETEVREILFASIK